jgi:hypothetical protein
MQVLRKARLASLVLLAVIVSFGILAHRPDVNRYLALIPGRYALFFNQEFDHVSTLGQFYIWNPLTGALTHQPEAVADVSPLLTRFHVTSVGTKFACCFVLGTLGEFLGDF